MGGGDGWGYRRSTVGTMHLRDISVIVGDPKQNIPGCEDAVKPRWRHFFVVPRLRGVGVGACCCFALVVASRGLRCAARLRFGACGVL